MATYMEQFVEKLRGFEGSIPWMYLDSVGKITVGVGQMLPTEASALALPFLLGDRPATPEEVSAEFHRVGTMLRGKMASYYRDGKSLHLAEATIEERLRGTVQGLESYLRTHLAGYDTFPDPVKMALLDMIYNLGPGRLFADFPRLLGAIARGDWKGAAAASERRGPAKLRNVWTREQFLQAASAVATEIKAGASQFNLSSFAWSLFAVATGALALHLLAERVHETPAE